MANTESAITDFQGIFARELTPALAGSYVASLVEKLGGAEQPLEELVEKGNQLHEYVGEKVYGPLLAGCVGWIEERCAKAEHVGPVFFALRDAAPLETVAKVAWNGKAIYPVGAYINRPMLQIEDEIAPESTNLNGRAGEYLGMLGLARMKRVVWADTGAWGTVVQALKMGYLKQTEFMPLFWYTHNPHIPGYLNGLLEESGLSDKFGETLNDSLECLFPQPHARPLDVVRGQNGWEVKLDVASYLSREWGQAALMGAHKAALTAYWQGGVTREQQRQQLAQLHELHLEAKSTGRWTGVLAENTPTWSSGAEFIKAWPANLLP